jgi:hypothetical protein
VTDRIRLGKAGVFIYILFPLRLPVYWTYDVIFIQTGYENWIHFSTLSQKMEVQEKIKWNAGNIVFFYVTVLSKNVAKCWL